MFLRASTAAGLAASRCGRGRKTALDLTLLTARHLVFRIFVTTVGGQSLRWMVAAALLPRPWGQDKRREGRLKIVVAAAVAAIAAVDFAHAATIVVPRRRGSKLCWRGPYLCWVQWRVA